MNKSYEIEAREYDYRTGLEADSMTPSDCVVRVGASLGWARACEISDWKEKNGVCVTPTCWEKKQEFHETCAFHVEPKNRPTLGQISRVEE